MSNQPNLGVQLLFSEKHAWLSGLFCCLAAYYFKFSLFEHTLLLIFVAIGGLYPLFTLRIQKPSRLLWYVIGLLPWVYGGVLGLSAGSLAVELDRSRSPINPGLALLFPGIVYGFLAVKHEFSKEYRARELKKKRVENPTINQLTIAYPEALRLEVDEIAKLYDIDGGIEGVLNCSYGYLKVTKDLLAAGHRLVLLHRQNGRTIVVNADFLHRISQHEPIFWTNPPPN